MNDFALARRIHSRTDLWQSSMGFFHAVCFCLCLSTGLAVFDANADIVTLKDGTTLRCQVIQTIESLDTDANYLEIRIGQSVIWLDQSAVDRTEKTEDLNTPNPEMEALVKRLMDEGILVSTIDSETDNVTPLDDTRDTPNELSREQTLELHAKEIRGWAYVYENEKAREDGKRTAVYSGNAIPLGSLLIVSPNTRMTLELPNIGEIGLEPGTEIRFDTVSKNRSRRNFSVGFRIDRGRCWLNFRPTERIVLVINSVRSILQDALLYVESTEKTGAIDITYLRGSGDLKFSRNRTTEPPYLIQQGQVLRVDPGINRLPVESADSSAGLQQRYDTWKDWQPEPLAVRLDSVIPPLATFPSFRALPALHSYKLTIDQTLLMPPEIRSLGEILAVYRQALEKFRLDTGRYPTFDHGLAALTESFDVPGWKGPYLSQELPRRDAWGNPFIYDLYTDKGRSYADVRSSGRNGKDDQGLGDDIR